MEMNKNLCRRLGNLSLPVLLSVVLLASCRDEIETGAYTGPYIRFSVSEGSEWHSTRAAGGPAEKAVPRDSVQPLHGGDGNTPLYLHTLYIDSIASPSSDSRPDTAVLTRATPVKTATLYESIGMLAAAFNGSWSETSYRPDYMYDVEVTKASNWTTSYHWPTLTGGIRFFAYAPYHGEGIVLSDKTKAGSPTITYTVPADVADQKDLLFANSTYTTPTGTPNANNAAALTFSHALTAVRFVCGDNMQGGTVKSVSLKNVCSKGTLNYGTHSWSDVDTPADFSQTLDKSTTGTPDEALTTDAQTFMMIPQTLPDGAQIEVVFTDNSGTDYTLTADIKGTEWPIGKTVIYKISRSSINWTYELSVSMPGDFTYSGGTQQYSVTSYKHNPSGDKQPAQWKAQFSEYGGPWTDTPPTWLTGFTPSGAGGETSQSYNATVSAQIKTSNDPHAQKLRDNPACGNVIYHYNLANQTDGGSTNENTANCYVVSASGFYCFPLVYGNAIKNGTTNTSAYTSNKTGVSILTSFINHTGNPITSPYIKENSGCVPAKAELLWQDAPDLISNVQYNNSKMQQFVNPENYISFQVHASTIRQGNAVIAIKDASDAILWSWHIWVTDENIGQTIEVTNHQSYKCKFMPVNLGWCDGRTETYAERSCKVKFTAGDASKEVIIKQASNSIAMGSNHPYYQWGRKDPFLPANGLSNTNKTWYDKDGNAHTERPKTENFSSGATCIMNCILKPDVIQSQYYGDNVYTNLWSADNQVYTPSNENVIKTIYDPSPVGFKLPFSAAFTGFTTTGDYTSIPSEINGTWDSSLRGWNFYTDSSKNKTIFFPAAGIRDIYNDGTIVDVGSYGYCWSAGPYAQNSSYQLFFDSSTVFPLGDYDRGCLFGVRSSQE